MKKMKPTPCRITNNHPAAVLNRRNFMQTGVAGTMGALLLSRWAGTAGAATEAPALDLKALFESNDPQLLSLAEDVFRQCVLGKIFPPEDPLKYNWIGPVGGYRGQWVWDTMFVVDLLSILPEQEKVIRDVFQNYWDFQELWNAQMPEYAHDMVTCNIKPGMDNVKARKSDA